MEDSGRGIPRRLVAGERRLQGNKFLRRFKGGGSRKGVLGGKGDSGGGVRGVVGSEETVGGTTGEKALEWREIKGMESRVRDPKRQIREWTSERALERGGPGERWVLGERILGGKGVWERTLQEGGLPGTGGV